MFSKTFLPRAFLGIFFSLMLGFSAHAQEQQKPGFTFGEKVGDFLGNAWVKGKELTQQGATKTKEFKDSLDPKQQNLVDTKLVCQNHWADTWQCALLGKKMLTLNPTAPSAAEAVLFRLGTYGMYGNPEAIALAQEWVNMMGLPDNAYSHALIMRHFFDRMKACADGTACHLITQPERALLKASAAFLLQTDTVNVDGNVQEQAKKVLTILTPLS